jgi:hypothetical protein
MRGLTKEFLMVWGGLILAYLVLEHSTGFSRDIGAIGHNLGAVGKTLQGR